MRHAVGEVHEERLVLVLMDVVHSVLGVPCGKVVEERVVFQDFAVVVEGEVRILASVAVVRDMLT